MIPAGSSEKSEHCLPAVLSDADVCKYLGDLTSLIALIEKALVDFSTTNKPTDSDGLVINPLRTTFKPHPPSFFMAMPVYYERSKSFACKLISSVAQQTDSSTVCRQELSAVLALFDLVSGKPLAFMEAEELTAFRTACISLVSAKYLLEQAPQKVAILGTGTQAASHIQVIAKFLKPQIISVWGGESSRRVAFCKKWSNCCERNSTTLLNAETVEEACNDAVFILSTSTGISPVLTRKAVTDKCRLITIVGAPTPTLQAAESQVLMDCLALYADSRTGALSESGDVIKSGREIYAELGEIISGSKNPCRPKNDNEKQSYYVVCKCQGVAVVDAASARYVYDSMKSMENGATS